MDVKVERVEGWVGSKGVLLRIFAPNGGALGRLEVGRANLRWYKGKTSKNYRQVTFRQFIEWIESQ